MKKLVVIDTHTGEVVYTNLENKITCPETLLEVHNQQDWPLFESVDTDRYITKEFKENLEA